MKHTFTLSALTAVALLTALPASAASWGETLRQQAAQLATGTAAPAPADSAAPAATTATTTPPANGLGALLGGVLAAGSNANANADTAATPSATPGAGLGSLLGGVLGTGAAAGAAAGTAPTGVASLLTQLGLPATATASNAAGVLTYCVKNNYLNTNKVEAVKNQLLGQLGLGTPAAAAPAAATQDQGYLNGLAGMVLGADGQTFSLDKIKGDLREKACDFVLNNAKSLL